MTEPNEDDATQQPSSYRWVIISLIWFCNFSGALVQLSSAPVQLFVAREFSLGAAQVATWINLPLLAIGLFSIPAGLLMDRIGARKALILGLLLGGTFGVVRGMATGFAFLCAATFLFGIGQAVVLTGMPKLIGDWFPKQELGRAVGISTSAAGIGVITVFLVTAPLFQENWRGLFLSSGAVLSFACLVWLVGGRAGPFSQAHQPSQSGLWQTLTGLLRKGQVRLLVGVCACTQIGIFCWLAFGFPFLLIAKGASEQEAGAVLSVTMLGFLLGALVTSGLSDRLGRRRPFFLGASASAAAIFVLLPWLPLGIVLWVGVLLIGFSLSALQVLLFALPLELDVISKEEVGACEGVIISLGFLAGIGASPILGRIVGDFTTATGHEFQLVLLALAATLILSFLLSTRIKETGWKVKT